MNYTVVVDLYQELSSMTAVLENTTKLALDRVWNQTTAPVILENTSMTNLTDEVMAGFMTAFGFPMLVALGQHFVFFMSVCYRLLRSKWCCRLIIYSIYTCVLYAIGKRFLAWLLEIFSPDEGNNVFTRVGSWKMFRWVKPIRRWGELRSADAYEMELSRWDLGTSKTHEAFGLHLDLSAKLCSLCYQNPQSSKNEVKVLYMMKREVADFKTAHPAHGETETQIYIRVQKAIYNRHMSPVPLMKYRSHPVVRRRYEVTRRRTEGKFTWSAYWVRTFFGILPFKGPKELPKE